jgi:5-methylcytosine-specific restriction endonuclease McrA
VLAALTHPPCILLLSLRWDSLLLRPAALALDAFWSLVKGADVIFEELSHSTSALRGVVANLDGDSLSGADAAALVERFSAISKLASAGIAICAKRVAETRYFKRCGHQDAASWLGERCGEPPGAARSLLATAGRLSGLSALDGALRAGELSPEQAAEVARGGRADPSSEGELIERARTGSLRELRGEADKAEASARSREQDEARYARIRAGRHLRTWLDADGAFKGRFALTPEDGALFVSGVESEANLLFDLARRAGLRETPREAYLADALVALVTGQSAGERAQSAQDRRGAMPASTSSPSAGESAARHPSESPARSAASDPPSAGESGEHRRGASPVASESPERLSSRGSPSTGKTGERRQGGDPGAAQTGEGPRSRRTGRPACTILFHVDIEALRRGSLAPGEECVVEGGGHVPLSVVQQYLDTARIHLLVKNGCDVVSIVSCKRTIPAVLQTALAARDRACVVPGCSSTFHLEIDHIVEFAKGGETKLSNLCRLCRPHHAMKSQEGFRIEGGPGNWRWVRPATDIAAAAECRAAPAEGRAAPAARRRPRPLGAERQLEPSDRERVPVGLDAYHRADHDPSGADKGVPPRTEQSQRLFD